MRLNGHALFLSTIALTTFVALAYHTSPNWGQPTSLQLKSTELLLQSSGRRSSGNLAISPDGNLLVANGITDSLQLYRKSDGQSLLTLKDGGKGTPVLAVAFAPDSKTIAGPRFDYQKSHQIILWDTQNGSIKQRLIGHSKEVGAVAFSPNGKLLASGSYDKTVKIWNTETGKLEKTVQISQSVEAVSFSPDSTIVRSADTAGTVQQWQIATGKLLQTLDPLERRDDPEDYRYNFAFSADGKLIARANEGRGIRVWNLETGKLVSTLPGHQGLALVVSFSPNGSLLASIGASGGRAIATGGNLYTVCLWDVQTGRLVAESDNDQYLDGLFFDPHLKTLVSAGDGGKVRLWELDAIPIATIPKQSPDSSTESIEQSSP
jgi:WD40 repeat protein